MFRVENSSASGHIFKRIESRDSDLCTPMFIAALFTVMSTEGWIRSTVWSIHTTEYHSVLKGKGILANAMTRTNLEDTVLSETSQLQKDTCHVILSI